MKSIYVHVLYISIAIFLVLQVGHNRENIGYYQARLEECGKIVNSDNYTYPNFKVPPTFDERWEMKKKCEDMAQKNLNKKKGWFWNTPEIADTYEERWHY